MRRSNQGFTLTELLVSIAVLVLLVLFVSRLVNSASSITILGHKRMEADSQTRQLFARMAIDFTQMVKRVDVDYYLKSATNPQSGGNDQIAFYSTVGGYYPGTSTTTQHSPVSLVAYRVNAQNKLERMGKGLLWNGSADTPVVFWTTILATWPAATTMAADSDYDEIGSQVFRFEYYYLLQNGSFSRTPWDTSAGHTDVSGMQDVAAIVVAIAVIDSKSKALLRDNTSPPQIAQVATQLSDYSLGMVPGELLAQWQSALDTVTDLPRPAISGIRLYERYFYLSPPAL